MADFKAGYQITIIGNEGGWNPGIGENPTYEGIDRGMNPKWPGWAIIDPVLQANPGASIHVINQLLAANDPLQLAIQAFYKANYWDDLNLSLINDQQIADNAFDCSVNPCIMGAGTLLQTAANNVLQSTASLLSALTVDGKIGNASITTINSLPAELMFNEMNAVRKANYQTRVVRTPKDAEWLPVWLSRLVQYGQPLSVS